MQSSKRPNVGSVSVLMLLFALVVSACGGTAGAPAATTSVPAAAVPPTTAPLTEATAAPAATSAAEPSVAPVVAATSAATSAPAATAGTAAQPTSGTASTGATGNYQGVTINVLTFTGPQIAEPLQRRGKEFAEKTGATINVTTVPFADLYQKILTDLSTQTNAFDVYVFAPQWMADYVTPGYLEPLDDRIAADSALQWNDVGVFFRDFSATYGGKTYTIPFDGDFQLAYYRTDLYQQLGLTPPNTWDDYLNAAKKISEAKLTTADSKPIYGSCISKKRGAQAYWFISSIAAGFIQTQGTTQGMFFDTDGMKPLVNNAAFARALDIYKETTQYGPPDELNLDVGDTRGMWAAGQCGQTLDWGDIGTVSIDKEKSQVIDKVGTVIMPGSDQVLDRTTGQLVKCDKTICPNADEKGVNHAPFAAFGGWSGAINAAVDSAKKDAAYAYMSYVNQPAQSNADVTVGATGFNPYRTSQFESTAEWEKAGMSKTAAENYLGAIKGSLDSPNMALDLRIPNNQYYQGQVLDTAVSQFLAGEIDRDTAMKQISDRWEEKTDELGRDAQLAAYKASLGVQR